MVSISLKLGVQIRQKGVAQQHGKPQDKEKDESRIFKNLKEKKGVFLSFFQAAPDPFPQ